MFCLFLKKALFQFHTCKLLPSLLPFITKLLANVVNLRFSLLQPVFTQLTAVYLSPNHPNEMVFREFP